MDIAIIENNQVIKLGNYKKLFPNVSFAAAGPNDDFLSENSSYIAYHWKEHDQTTHKLVTVHPYLENGYVYTVEVVEKTADDLSSELNIEAETIRLTRNQLLKDTDWTQVLDAPIDRTAYATYRQALRDITLQEGFPLNIEWPTL
jgi:hypothetical protein